MKLKYYIKDSSSSIDISLAYENEYYLDRSGSKIYTSFFNGKIKDIPDDFYNLDVVKMFTSLFWGNNTYIIRQEV